MQNEAFVLVIVGQGVQGLTDALEVKVMHVSSDICKLGHLWAMLM